MTIDQFLDMLEQAREAGYISDIHCATHDGIRTTGSEAAEWEAGFDPCQPVVRLWGPGEGDSPSGLPFDEDLDPGELLDIYAERKAAS